MMTEGRSAAGLSKRVALAGAVYSLPLAAHAGATVTWVSTRARADVDPSGTGVKIGRVLPAAGYAAVDLTVRDDGLVCPRRTS